MEFNKYLLKDIATIIMGQSLNQSIIVILMAQLFTRKQDI